MLPCILSAALVCQVSALLKEFSAVRPTIPTRNMALHTLRSSGAAMLVPQFRRTNNSESLAIEAGQGLRRLLRNSWRVRFGRGGVERSASRGSCSERRFRSPRAVLRIRVRCLIRDSASLSSVISGLVWLVVKGAYSRERLPPGGARCLVALLVVDSEEGQ